MVQDLIRYDILTQEALRGVVRTVISEVATSGLPGEHHLYITFDLNASGVGISDTLRSQHANEMTIVLQHQFWDLEVHDDRFEIGLAFNGVPEKLVVPFDAIKGFYDPSVQFGLQFETLEAAEGSQKRPLSKARKADGEPLATLPGASGKNTESKPEDKPHEPAKSMDESAAKKKTSARGTKSKAKKPTQIVTGENVISIDTFRQK